MKKLLSALLILISTSLCFAQTETNIQRHISFKAYGKDSVNLSLNDAYYMIEDSCASIIRYAHVNYDKKIFVGDFKDVRKTDPSIIMNQGHYNEDGQKDGDFIVHYPNGNLRAKGRYSKNKFIGKWELFYEDGNPEVTFTVEDGVARIDDAWDANKVQLVHNGNGHFVVNNGNVEIVWHGKLTDGRPDSVWNFSSLNDLRNHSFSETFKKGKFIKGKNPMTSYDDASHIVLVDEKQITINNAETFSIAPVSCDPNVASMAVYVPNKHSIIHAHYFNGPDAFVAKINQAMATFRGVKVESVGAKIVFDAVIDEKGNIGSFTSSDTFDERLSRDIISRLEYLPQLLPATYDTKPAKEKFRITFYFNNYSYNYRYEFLKVIPPGDGSK
jgi:hypothetical protein